MSKFGESLRMRRHEHGLTLGQLAKLTGSSKSYIWALENLDPLRPSADKVQKIASVLGTTMEAIITGTRCEDCALHHLCDGCSRSHKDLYEEVMP
jgi:transcriptional regulator with XRE-family HTH domain